MLWQPADRPASTFPPRPFTPPLDCNNVSKCSSAWRWMGTLLNTTCHLSNPRLVTGGERQSSNLRCLWWEEGLDACWASETIFLGFSFTRSDGNCTPGVFATLCLMICQIPACFAESWALKTVMQLCCLVHVLVAGIWVQVVTEITTLKKKRSSHFLSMKHFEHMKCIKPIT